LFLGTKKQLKTPPPQKKTTQKNPPPPPPKSILCIYTTRKLTFLQHAIQSLFCFPQSAIYFIILSFSDQVIHFS